MRLTTLALSLIASTAGVAATAGLAAGEVTRDVEIRQVNTAMRVIGCSRYIQECAGATSTRTGLVVVDVTGKRLQHGKVALVGMFLGAARPERELLASQMISGGGARVSLGQSWVQGAVGFAASQVAHGPKTITTTRALTHGAPALLLGAGTRSRALGVPVEISLDVGTSIDGDLAMDHPGRVYQVTANVLFAEL
jgi:hypothetical protein